jgi:hypothetical protein
MWSLPFDEFGGRGLVVTIFFMFCWLYVFGENFSNVFQSIPFPSRLCISGGGQIDTSCFLAFSWALMHYTNHNCAIRTMQLSWFLTMIIWGHCSLLQKNDCGLEKNSPCQFLKLMWWHEYYTMYIGTSKC